MDELFLLPQSPMAMPRAYWISQSPQVVLCSSVMLVAPSAHEFDRVLAESQKVNESQYDMEMVNNLYRNEAIVLPHHAYMLLTGEFRDQKHKVYLGEDETAVWDADQTLKEAKYIHFSDWPLPKPWIEADPSVWKKEMPKCYNEEGNVLEGDATDQCRDREVWVGIYEDFKKRRTDICGANFYEEHYSRRKNGLAAAENLLNFEGEAIELEREHFDSESVGPDLLELRTPGLA